MAPVNETIVTNFDYGCGIWFCGPNYLLILEPLAISFGLAVMAAICHRLWYRLSITKTTLKWVWVGLMTVGAFAIIPVGAEYVITDVHPAYQFLQGSIVALTSLVMLAHVYYHTPTRGK